MKPTITIQCLECGCTRVIEELQVPVGHCPFCVKDFGWYGTNFRGSPYWPLQDGDKVVLNTRLSPEHGDRLHSVERAGKIVYEVAK